MLASFKIVPLEVGTEFKEHVARIIALVEESDLEYRLGAMQTTVEGTWDEVMSLVRRCHDLMRDISPRVLTSVSIDDREGAEGRLSGKVEDVEAVLGRKAKHE